MEGVGLWQETYKNPYKKRKNPQKTNKHGYLLGFLQLLSGIGAEKHRVDTKSLSRHFLSIRSIHEDEENQSFKARERVRSNKNHCEL